MNEKELVPNIVESEMTPEEVIALSKKVTVLMTKPENTDTEAPLLLFLKNKGLNAQTYRFILDENRLNNLYPDMKGWTDTIQIATKQHLLNTEVEVFLVTADNELESDVREEVLNLRGLKRNAEENISGTLRKDLNYSSVFYPNPHGGETIEYSRNGFHCSTTPEEVVSNLKTFGLLDEAKKLAGI